MKKNMEEKIISLQNQKIKNIIKLRKNRERKKRDLIIIEGRKEIEAAEQAGINLTELFFCSELAEENRLKLKFNRINFVSQKVFEKISVRENPDGWLALARPRFFNFSDIDLSKNILVVILEALEKPGNLGAILRTADAVGVATVIINEPQTDIYNHNVIRSSRGAVFFKKIIIASIKETKDWLKKNKIKSFAAALTAKESYLKANFSGSSAIVLGREDKGLSQAWLEAADELIKIPMLGRADSLNVSVSAAIILFEALRQRMN